MENTNTTVPTKLLRARNGTTSSYRPDTATVDRLERIAGKVAHNMGVQPSVNVILRRATQFYEEYLDSDSEGLYVFDPGYEKQRLLMSAEGWEVGAPVATSPASTLNPVTDGDF